MNNRKTEQQIPFALRQASSGTPVGGITRRMGISEPTFYRWKKQYAGLEGSDIRRLEQLKDESRRLKQFVPT